MTSARVLLLLLSAVFLLHSHVLAVEAEEEVAIDPDVDLDVKQIVQKRGYAVEEHKVTTSDRYVLTMYRLPKSYAETQAGTAAAANKPAVILQHGLLDSSYTWVNNFRTQSLAFILADAGFDVWLGNNRGTTWSRTHLDYSTNDDKFWDFTWEDMGKYDIPAEINKVLDVTKRPTVSYVGHSEGTTQAFVGFSANQEVAKKVSYFGALAPIAWTGHARAEIFVLLAKLKVDEVVAALGISEFLDADSLSLVTDVLGRFTCALADGLCGTALQLIAGPSNNVNTSRIHVYLSQTPAGTSVKNMGHYAQGIRDNTFASYDYGCSCIRLLGIGLCSTLICKNKAVYGSFDPPAFPLKNMKYPRTGFYVATDDTFGTATDVAQLRSALPSGTIVYEKSITDFSHLDFTWAINANTKLYGDLITQLKLYDGKTY